MQQVNDDIVKQKIIDDSVLVDLGTVSTDTKGGFFGGYDGGVGLLAGR